MKRKIKTVTGRILLYMVLCLFGLVCILPLYWMIRSSFMRNVDIYITDPFVFWPKEMLLKNYYDAFHYVDFMRYIANTLVIVAFCLCGTLITSTMAAYSFARINWKGKGFCFACILATMMLPGAVTLIPQYIIWGEMQMIDTYWPLILPSFLGGGAFNIFLLRQFILGIPRELDEAARIDGAGPVQVFVRIILPLAKSAIVVVAIFTFFNVWNEFFSQLLYLNSKDKFTIAVGLLQFRSNYGTKWNLVMSASTMVVIPSIVVYIIGQKRLIEGVAVTGLKG